MKFRWLLFVLLILLHISPASAQAPRQGASLLKADLVAVLAHPDDETGLAPTLAHYALGQNKRVVNIYCTRGEGGGNMVGRQWGPSLGILRESELRQCLDILGVERAYFLDQRDWAYTESAQMTLEAWDHQAALEQLVRLFRSLRPEVVVTMNPVPRPGQHGHHQAAAILAVEAFHQAADTNAFFDQIRDEGLDPWQPRKLYMTASPDPYGATIPSTTRLPDGRTAAEVAGQALSHHRSQGFGRMADSPWLARPRSYRLLKSATGYASAETDLFQGLEDASQPDLALSPLPLPPGESPRKTSMPSWRLEARPALERFQRWAQVQGLPGLSEGLAHDIPVPAGQTSLVYLVPTGTRSSFPDESEPQFVIAPPWSVSLSPEALARGRVAGRIPLKVQVPEAAREDAVLKVIWQNPDRDQETTTLTLHPVPKVHVSRMKTLNELDILDPKHWNGGPVIRIPYSQTWQGKVESPEDNSATAWVGYTDEGLWIRVDVLDDLIVSNIQPNDIRGHWRSDSVEICVDPGDGSEHTLKAFKAGIFPFDASGQVRAARDADANQGPIERTAPGMRLKSESIDGGYRIVTVIPWKHIGISPEPGTRLAFNILVYDGDKADALPGENIGQSRLAWSPRSGVQGRPEDWGRIVLK
jgi:LmbE family N-acetylglucosaminyl deacetylase